jgi:glycosyltransferase involved in cell wall biosynthesis
MIKKIVPIDIVIVTHNRYEKLLRCVSYILSNIWLPKTIIIIHSQPESKCKTKKIIEKLCLRVGVDIKYINIPHKGISFSRNKAISCVVSPIFGFIDDDEYPTENWIKFAYSFFVKNKKIHVLTGPKIATNKFGYWGRIWYEIYRSSFEFIGQVDFVTSGNSFFRTEFIKENNISFDNDFATSSEDRVFSFFLQKKKAKMIFHKNLIEYHDFRDTSRGLFLQWYGYGKSMAIYKYKYVYKSKLKVFQSLKELLQGFHLLKKNWFLILPIMMIDFAFMIGFIGSLINIVFFNPVDKKNEK